MAGRYEVILAGSGGQGLVVSGIMLGEAAILDGKNVVQTVSYGIASRGGFSQAEVIIDRDEIIFQQVEQPDIVLALTEEAMEMYAGLTRRGTRGTRQRRVKGAGHPPEGWVGYPPAGTRVFYDSTLPAGHSGPGLTGYPFTRLAADLGHPGAANMIALGAVSAATGLVDIQSLVKVIEKRFSPPLAATNVKALYAGVSLVTGEAERS